MSYIAILCIKIFFGNILNITTKYHLQPMIEDNPKIMITLLINFCHLCRIFSTIFHEPNVSEILVVPQNFCHLKTLWWRYQPCLSRLLLISPILIKPLDDDDTEAETECQKLNFELQSNAIHHNICLQKINRMVPKSEISDKWLKRNSRVIPKKIVSKRRFNEETAHAYQNPW